MCPFQQCSGNDRNTWFSPNTYFTEREDDFLQRKFWRWANIQVSFLDWREGNKGHEIAIPFHIYRLRNFSLVFSSERSIGSGIRCSNKESQRAHILLSPAWRISQHSWVCIRNTRRNVTVFTSCQNEFLAWPNFAFIFDCFHSRVKFEPLPKYLWFTKLAHSITGDTFQDERWLVVLYRLPVSPSVHSVGKTYLTYICWNLRCYFTKIKLAVTVKG